MKKLMILVMVAAFALPTVAQIQKEQPQAQFQSTSTMQPSGSVLASQPMLNADGTAYNPTAASAPSGPRRSSSSDPWGENKEGGITNDNSSPVGDAVLPLMLMALAFGGVIYLRRRKRA